MNRPLQLFFILAALLLLSACVPIPTRDNPPAYTRSFVHDAIRLYRRDGRQALIDRYAGPQNLDGQWYLIVLDENHRIIAHYDPGLIGADSLQVVDATGYRIGEAIAATDEQGRWFVYLWPNPQTGREDRKHTWAIRLDGLIFASGWYEQQ